MDNLTVVMTTGPSAAEVTSLVESWSKAGLTGESLWVQTQEIVRNGRGPARVPAIRIGAESSIQGDLFELVGVRRVALLRLVAVHLVTHSFVTDEGFVAAARDVATQLADSMPHSTEATRSSATQLRRINLIVAESGAYCEAEECLIPGWEVNAVVASEDRPDLDRGSVFVRGEANFAGHAAAAIASVGGLWVGIPAGALDPVEQDSTVMDRDILVSRTSVRAVLGADPVHAVAAQAMSLFGEDETVPATYLNWAWPASDPRAIVRGAAEFLLGRGDWQPEPPPATPVPGIEQVPFGRALGEAIRFNVGMLRLGSAFLVRSGWNALEERATNAIVGNNTDARVRIRPATADLMLGVAERRFEVLEEQVRSESRAARTRTVPAPRPETWQELRATCFALADGGPLPEGLPVPQHAGQRELLPRWAIAPDPLDRPEPSAGLSGGLRDPLAYRDRIREVRDQHRAALERESLAAKAVAVDEAEAAAARGAVEQREGAGAPPGPPPLPDNRTQSQSASDLIEEELAELEACLSRRQRSITWSLAEEVADRLASLRGAGKAATGTQTLDVDGPAETLRKAERRVRFWWRFSFVWALVSAAVIVVLQGALSLIALPLAATIAVVLVIPIGATVTVHHRYYRAQRRFLRAVDLQLAQRLAASEQALHARRELARTEILYRALIDWSEIIGYLAHHPWRTGRSKSVEVGEALVGSLPAAVGIASTYAADPASSRRSAIQAIAYVALPGWMSSNFDELVSAMDVHDQNPEEAIAADLDVLDSPISPRRQMLEACQESFSATVAASAALLRVQEAAAGGELALPERSVERLGRFGEGRVVTESEFFGGCMIKAPPFSREQWTPTGLTTGRHLPERSLAWVPHAEPHDGHGVTVRPSNGFVAMRVDISRRASTTDLTLFDRMHEEGARRPPAEESTGDTQSEVKGRDEFN